MGSEQRTRIQSGGTVSRNKPPKWYYVYFLLAAFDLVTVSAGLWLNHRIMGIYLQSVEVNRVWAERVSAYSHLGELAGDVDAPGNDVFDTRDVDQESLRMENAVRAFDLDIQKQRNELDSDLTAADAAPLVELLDAIAVAKTQMTQEAVRIFDYFREGRADLAGERMTAASDFCSRLHKWSASMDPQWPYARSLVQSITCPGTGDPARGGRRQESRPGRTSVCRKSVSARGGRRRW